jgi:putative restriction endonuclease
LNAFSAPLLASSGNPAHESKQKPPFAQNFAGACLGASQFESIMPSKPAKRVRWTKRQLLIALNVYHKLKFGQFHARQAVIIDVAAKLGRTPSSLAMKLCNFASLDPVLKLRGIAGLAGASILDREVWGDFHSNIDELAPASEAALRELFDVPEDAELAILPKEGVRARSRAAPLSTEALGMVKIRRGLEYFREGVLNNFEGKCAVTALDVRSLLVAS